VERPERWPVDAIKILALAELALKIAMLVDIKRRLTSQIRGPKRA
jgi:hypothetical protein